MFKKIQKRLFVILLTVTIIAAECAVSFFPVAAASYSTNDGYFHDQGGDYMSPVAPTSSQAVTLKLRTPSADSSKNDKIYIRYTTNNGDSWTDISMTKTGSILDGIFDIWQGTIPATSSRYYYQFKLVDDGLIWDTTNYFGLGGKSSSQLPIANCYQVWPNFSTPEWSHGAYWYYVAPTSFFNGDSLNDIGGDMSDYASGKKMNADHYKATYGGDVKGVSKKLSYIKDLGCTGVYLNPLHLSYNAIGYGIMNNYMLDSQYTTENEYKQFVNSAHNNDMRVMFDVLAHSVIDANVWFNSYNKYPVVGAYNSASSAFRNMFHFDSNGAVTKFLSSNALDYANDVTKNLMYKNEDSYLSRYLSDEYGADALRFDAGAHLYGTGLTINRITEDLTSTLKSRYPDKLLICENYSDDSNSTSHLTSGWDTCWNTPMIYWIRGLAEGTQTISGFVYRSIHDVLTWPRDMVLSMQQLITSHDLERLQNSADETGRRMARIFQMTYVGSPMLYYGDETDAESLYNSKIEQFDWNKDNWNMNTYNLVKGLGQLRNEYTCLKNGVVKFGQSDNDAKTLSMARWDKNGAVISLLNGNNSAVDMSVNVAQFEVANGTVLTDYFTGKTYTVSNGSITASVLAGGTVLVTGGNTVSTIGKYNKTLLGGSGTATLGSDSTTITLSGKGSVTTTSDSGLFVYSEADSGFELGADVSTTGTVALALRDTKDAQSKGYYAVVNGSNKTISVYKREANNQASTLVTTANYTDSILKIKLVRSGNNDFSVQTFEKSAWTTVANSQVKFSLSSKLYAGAINLSGTATIGNMGITIYDNTYYDGFISDKIVAESATYTVQNISLDKTVYGKAKLSSEIYTERTGNTNGGYDALIVHLGNVTHTSASWSEDVTGDWYLYLSREYGLEMRVKKLDGSEWYWGAHYKTLNYPDSNSLEFKGPYTLKYALSNDNLKVWINGQLMYDYDYTSWFSVYSGNVTTKLNFFATGYGMTESRTPVTKVTDYKVWTDETDNNTLSASFAASGNYTVSGGKLKFTASGLNTYLNTAPQTDWTVKTVVGATSGYAGAAAYANENDFILGGRNGGKIILARVIGGNVVAYDAVADKRTTAELQLQLQKVGNYFSLSYRYNDEYEWKTLSNRIFASYTTLEYGLAASNTAEFDYITLGNMIDEGVSLCTPISKGNEVEFNYSKLNSVTNMVKWNAPSGTWENVAGGLSQTGTSESYYVTKSQFADFKAEVTLGVSGSGYSGVIFASENGKITNGYSLTLKQNGVLYLNIDNSLYDMKNVSFDADGKLRIIIERIGDRIIIYTNQNPTVAFNILDTTYTEGYFGFTTSNAEGYFGNYTVFSLADSWTEETTTYIGSDRITYADNSVRLNANSEKTVALHQKGISYTDVLASVELSYTTAENSYAGLSFASTEGTNPFDKGIVIALKDNSTVVVLKDGTEVASELITANSSNQLSVSIKNGKYEIFFNDLIAPVLTYYGGKMGGNVGVAAKNVDAAFTSLIIDDISGTNVFDSLGYYKASVNSASKSVVEGEIVTLHTPTNSLGYTNNGYSYSIVNNSGLVNTEYFALSSSNFEADGCYEVSGILKSGAYTSNSNMDLYYAITVAFRKVTYSDGTSGYLKLALTKASGGISIIFDNDYYEANNRKYLKYDVKYDDGTYIRNDNIDNRFRIISDDKTVSVWLNGTLVIDSFDYSAKATNVAPAAGIGYNCCRCNITDFTINKASSSSTIIKNVGTNGFITLSNDSPTAGEKVTITKNGIIASGTFNVYYLNYDKVEKIVAERIGYREDESSVDTYSFVMPDTENPVVITCDFTDDTTANISALGAQYRENGTKADIRFGTRLGYKVTDGIITVSDVDYELIETGTLITTVTALNTVEGTHEELVTLGSESLWGEQHKYIKNVKRTKYYDYCNEYIDFAVSVTGISDFDKVYVARGYVLTKDTSGNNVVFYTDVIYRTVNGVK